MAGCSPLQDLTLEGDLSDIEAVAQQMGERAARERNAADGLSGLQSLRILLTMPRLRSSAISRLRLPSLR